MTKEEKKVLRSLMHPATESPGKKSVYIFFRVKGHRKLLCELIRFWHPDVRPAEVAFKMDDRKTQKLAVGWMYADELASVITKRMEKAAESCAWAWYNK